MDCVDADFDALFLKLGCLGAVPVYNCGVCGEEGCLFASLSFTWLSCGRSLYPDPCRCRVERI